MSNYSYPFRPKPTNTVYPSHPPGTHIGDELQLTEQAVTQYEAALQIAWEQLTGVPDSVGDVVVYEDRLAAVEGFEDERRTALNKLNNVKNFGAIGDGIADDTQALQDALDANEVMIIPPGVYRTTAELVMTSNTTLVGHGNIWNNITGSRNDTCIRYDGPADPNIAVLRMSRSAVGVNPTLPISHSNLLRITLDANDLAGYGLWAAYVTDDSVIENVTGVNASQHGIRIEKMWYARVTGLVARNCGGCGITIGRNDWGGVNGISFRNLRASFCGGDHAFDQATNYEWGYGVGLYLGSGSTVENVVGERNDGPGLLYSMTGGGSVNSVRGAYLEANCLDAKTEGRADRNYGLIVKGAAFSRAHRLETIYLNGEVGDPIAQGVLLTGAAPSAAGSLAFRDMAHGEGFDAEWSTYNFEGYIYHGLTGTENSMYPGANYEVIFSQVGVNLRFTSSLDQMQGFVDNRGSDTSILFIPNNDVTLGTAPVVRFQNYLDSTEQWYSWTMPTAMTGGQIYGRSFASGSLGAEKMGVIIVPTPADVDCVGTILLVRRVQQTADYEL